MKLALRILPRAKSWIGTFEGTLPQPLQSLFDDNLRVVLVRLERELVAEVAVPLLGLRRADVVVGGHLGRSQAHHILRGNFLNVGLLRVLWSNYCYDSSFLSSVQ